MASSFGTAPIHGDMHKKTRIIKLLTVAALLWINLFLCNFARAGADIDYYRIGWWNIKFTEINNGLNGCSAIANFQGQTSIKLGLYQHADGYRQWVVHIYNPQWAGWIGSRKQHILHFVAAKRWQGTFSVANDNSLYSFVSVEFMNSLADAYTLTIMSANNYVLTHLSMQDSEATIRAVVIV